MKNVWVAIMIGIAGGQIIGIFGGPFITEGLRHYYIWSDKKIDNINKWLDRDKIIEQKLLNQLHETKVRNFLKKHPIFGKNENNTALGWQALQVINEK